MVTPSARKAGVRHLEQMGICSERHSCKVVGVWRSVARYIPRRRPEEGALVEEIRALAMKQKRFGYRRITALLRRKGMKVNTKRVHRIWKAEGLGLPRKRPKKRRTGPLGEPLRRAERPNQVWSYDFLEDRTERGGRLRFLTVLDEYTRKCLAIRVGRSIDSLKVIRILEELFAEYGIPEYIRSDNGPEFIAEALKEWLRGNGCKTIFIEPGSPWENPYSESFNGKFRDECLNTEIFRNASEAQLIAEAWRYEYNRERPHSALGYLTPEEFARNSGSLGRATPSLGSQNAEEKELILT